MLCFFGQSCDRGADLSASRYNDLIIDEVHRANQKMTQFYTGPTDEPESHDALVSYIEMSRDRLANIGAYKDDNSLHEEAVKMIDFYRGLCDSKNIELIDATSGSFYTRQDSAKAILLLTEIVKENNRMNRSFEEVQQSFADRHGLLLVE